MSIVTNEELMEQLQRVSVLSRRSRRAKVKERITEEGGDSAHGHSEHHRSSKPGHRTSRNAVAFGDTEASHSYGNHKCHGGSGRHGQNRILAVLALQEGINQKDLAYLLGIRPQSLGEALVKLEESGLIRKEQNADDHRSTNVFLTAEGKSRAKKVAEDRKKTAADVFQVLDEAEKEQLTGIFGKLSASLEEQLSA